MASHGGLVSATTGLNYSEGVNDCQLRDSTVKAREMSIRPENRSGDGYMISLVRFEFQSRQF